MGYPWAGKEIENPTQTHAWRGLVLAFRLSRGLGRHSIADGRYSCGSIGDAHYPNCEYLSKD
jgi:hypothetical protein